MTPEVHKDYDTLKQLTDCLAFYLEHWEKHREAFEAEACKYAGGAMDVILPHFMSISDMKRSQDNLNKALRVSRLLGQLRAELVNPIQEERIHE